MKKYTFEKVEFCEMCCSETSRHKLLGQRLNQSQGFSPKKSSGISVSIKKCTSCNLIYSSPQPIPNNILDHYGLLPEEYWVGNYFVVDPNNFSQQIRTIKKLMSISKDKKSLDIGAGLGKSMIALDAAGFDSYGLEPAINFYDRAISKMGINPNKLKLGMIEDVEYEAGMFDFITFGAVFEHLYHPATSLEKSLKWLKSGGIVHIEVPSSKYFISKLINLYYRLMGTTYVTHLSPMHSPFHLYEFGYESFVEVAKRFDCEIVAHQYDVCNIMTIPKIFHPILKTIMKFTNTGMQLTVYLKKK
jgi:2-polyprenyl-3-methyl-5-hydroxy-6-metoxy-1,4-benzoquinol methylase